MRLPGICQDCREPVHWNGFRWIGPGPTHHQCRNPGQTARRASGRCGIWMPQAREWCARYAGHAYEHRSSYALKNAARARSAA